MTAKVDRIVTYCETCGKQIERLESQIAGEHVYCGWKCAQVASRTRFEIECRWCGKKFEVTPTEYKKGKRLCSWECRVAEKEDAKHRICAICGKHFDVIYPSRKTQTCSRKCGSELRKRGKFINCEVCGKQVWVMPCHFDERRFCSWECSYIAKGIENRGENNHNWKGGISLLPYPFGWSSELKEAIKKRDGYVCQNCGETENLVVHHIDYDKSNLSFDNLITVCNSCNSKANYGRKQWTAHYQEIVQYG